MKHDQTQIDKEMNKLKTGHDTKSYSKNPKSVKLNKNNK